MSIKMDELRGNGIIESVEDGTYSQRLMELGFCAGARVRYVRSASFGGPMMFCLNERSFYVLRPVEARTITCLAV